MRLLIFMPILTCLLFACGNSSQGEAPKAFFNLAGYMDSETTTLLAQTAPVTKSVTVDGILETQNVQPADLAQDLQLFGNADINRPAWVDKYQLEVKGIDTSYIATDSSLRTQVLRVFRGVDNNVNRIEIERRSGSVLSSGQQRLIYEPRKGYQITTSQNSNLVGDVAVEVIVNF